VLMGLWPSYEGLDHHLANIPKSTGQEPAYPATVEALRTRPAKG
jgi:hypothetical protein